MKIIIEDSIIFDTEDGTLNADGRPPVPLKHNESLLLQFLINGITEKNDLIARIWDKTAVTDSSYHKLIFELRSQLEKAGADPKIIRTIPRRGCHFAGKHAPLITEPPVQSAEPPPAPLTKTEAAPTDPEKSPWKFPGILSGLPVLSIVFLGFIMGWTASDMVPSLFYKILPRGSNHIYIVGQTYTETPKFPHSGGDIFYIKGRKSTTLYLCDAKDRSDLNCKNEITY